MIVVPGMFLRVVSVALVALAAWEARRGWLRHRDRYRADILWVVGLLAPVLLFGDELLAYRARERSIAVVINLLFLLQPFFLLRLVSRFRDVASTLMWTTLAIAMGGAVIGAVWAPAIRGGWTPIVCAYFTAQLAYAAHAFGRESQRAAGVTGSRLWFASLGTWLYVFSAVVLGAETLVASMAAIGPGIRQMLGVGVFASYYAGLVAPRALRAIWAQRELYRHIRETAARDPTARATEAPADLQRAVGHGVASIARAVLLFDDGRPGLLMARATNISTWARLEVRPGAGLLGRALSRGTPVVGSAADFEPELAALAAPLGRHVWAVPIASAGRRWGLLIVVQRYGSLFPDDDLELITVLCQHTAAALDHAQLVHVERDDRERLAAVRLRERETRFNQILQSITDRAVLVLDEAGHVLEWKAGADALFGHAAEDILGQSAASLFSLDVAGFDLLLMEARRGVHASEGRCRRRDGTDFIAHVTVHPLAPDAAGLTGFVVVVRDETELRAAAEWRKPTTSRGISRRMRATRSSES